MAPSAQPLLPAHQHGRCGTRAAGGAVSRRPARALDGARSLHHANGSCSSSRPATRASSMRGPPHLRAQQGQQQRACTSRPGRANWPVRPQAQHPVQRRRRVVARASAQQPDDHQQGGGSDAAAGPGAQRVYRMWSQQPHVGAEHGEGFLRFTPGGGPASSLDVDALNAALAPSGALRLRHAQAPHEAHGMVFNFDAVVADLGGVKAAAWRGLAAARGLPLPPSLAAHPDLADAPPQVAIARTLRWAPDPRAAAALALEHAALAGRELAARAAPQPGVAAWLDALARFNVPCAAVSALDKATVQAALARMALHDHFAALVTAEDEADSIAQRLLGAAVKLGRPPNLCVAFDACPAGITAAHNCTMKAVAVQGRYRSYQLKAADLTCGSLSELAVYNVRRLFANAGAEFMDLQQQQAAPHDADDEERGRWRRSSRRRVTSATL